MSTSKLYLNLISTVLAVILITGTGPSAFSQQPYEGPSGHIAITFISGQVLILKKDASQWQSANPGDLLSEGDSIKTLDSSKAKLQFPTGSTIIVNEKTSMAIDKLPPKRAVVKETELSLRQGRVKAVIEGLLNKESKFEVRTPTAVAGVVGTVFYLNVVKKPEGIVTSMAEGGSKQALLLADKLLGIKKCFAAGGERFVTEIFVEKGNVEFTNILSNISYKVGTDKGSYADEEGKIAEPKYVPPDKQKEWKEGFELSKKEDKKKEGKKEDKKKAAKKGVKKKATAAATKKKQAKKKQGEPKKERKAPVTRKSEASVVKKDAPKEPDTPPAEPKVDTPDTDDTADTDETKDEQNDNNSDEKTKTQPTDTKVGANIVVGNDADGDGVADDEDDFPHDANFSKWADAADADGDSIPDGKEDFQLAEELRDLYNDVEGITQSITLAQLDGKLTEIQDAQDGKVILDIHGNRVRLDNYILRPTNKKVEVVFLSHRRTGEHSGVSSLAFEVTFNQDLPNNLDLKTLPWSEYMGSDGDITYSAQPAYYPKRSDNLDPSVDTPGMVLTMRNPSGDHMSIYEGFGELANVRGTWQQPELDLTYNMDINGVLKDASYQNGTTTGGSYSVEQTFADSTYYKLSGYVIDDYGVQQAKDTYTDGSSQDFRIGSARSLLKPDRSYNLEITVDMTTPGASTKKIDVIVAPEVMRPYHDN